MPTVARSAKVGPLKNLPLLPSLGKQESPLVDREDSKFRKSLGTPLESALHA
jgi:hypothetical protein